MKTLGLALLWISAVLFAVWLLVRARRGKPVVLKGTWKPRFARMVVVILLALGVSAQTSTAGEPEDGPAKKGQPVKPGAVPEILDKYHVRRMRSHESLYKAFCAHHALLRAGKPAGPSPIQTGNQGSHPLGLVVVLAELEIEAARTGIVAEQSADFLTSVLDRAERQGFIGHFTVGLVWRATRAIPPAADAKLQAQLETLIDRLYQHARLANAFIKAHAEVKPLALPPRAWMSKAGPKRDERLREEKAQRDILAAARKHYPNSNAAPWSTEGGITTRARKGGPALTIRRGGQATTVGAGHVTHVGRLDLIDTRGIAALTLEHTLLGPLTLPGGQLLSVWDLSRHLDPLAAKRVEHLVLRALMGDEDASTRVEGVLSLAHASIRKVLDERPDAKGAQRLRTLLYLFTD